MKIKNIIDKKNKLILGIFFLILFFLVFTFLNIKTNSNYVTGKATYVSNENKKYYVEINKPVEWTFELEKNKQYLLPKEIIDINTLDKENLQIIYNNKKYSLDEFLNKKEEILKQKTIYQKALSLIGFNISDKIEVKSNKNTFINYKTPGPKLKEKIFSENKKLITISSELHYENVLAYSEIKETKKENIKLYWVKENEKVLFENVNYIDTNNNGFIDKIEWVVPHLSEQIFEIIIITKADHLDKDRNYVETIYDSVRLKDDVWSKPIYNNEYIRVTFRQPLSNKNDITIYARNPEKTNTKVEVYYENSNVKITEFPIIDEEKYYKVYLTNLNNSYDTFDLKIVNLNNDDFAYLEFEHIIDPEYTGDFFLLWDGDSIPDGWTCVSCNTGDPFYNRTIRGNSQYAFGGSSTHAHVISYVSETQSDANLTNGYGANANYGASPNHVHGGIQSAITSYASNYPLFRTLKVIKYSGIPSVIPQNAIALFNTSDLPPNWNRYDTQDNYFVLGYSQVGITGGSNMHNHTATVILNSFSATTKYKISGTDIAHATHSHGEATEITNNSNTMPPYITVVLAKATADTSIPVGFIGMFNLTPPETWSVLSNNGGDFYQRHIYAASSYGTKLGQSTNTHSNLQITTGTSTSNVSSGSGTTAWALATHRHTVTVSFNTSENEPPYRDVIFALATLLTTNKEPNATLGTPLNNTIISYGNPILLNITYKDGDNDLGNIVFVNSSNSATLCTNNSIPHNSVVYCAVNLDYGQELKWYVNTSDGLTTIMNGVWNFSVEQQAENNAPNITPPLLRPFILRENLNAIANTTYSDAEANLGTITFVWYVNNQNVYNQTFSNVENNTIVDSTLYYGNFTIGDKINVSVFAEDISKNSGFYWSETKQVWQGLPQYNNYTNQGETTNFDLIEYLENVYQPIIEKPNYGQIKWLDTINVSKANLDNYITISYNYISVDVSNLNPTFNTRANLTLYNMPYKYQPILYRDGIICDLSYCTLQSYQSNTLKFNVSSFSSYTSGANSKLTVWDETDNEMPYANKIKYINESVIFFVNYTNKTSGEIIYGNNVFCNISILSGWKTMEFNTTNLLYQYETNFTNSGTFIYNVSCDGSDLNYEPLNLSDNVVITESIKKWNNTFNTTEKQIGKWNISVFAIADWFFNVTIEGRNFTLSNQNTYPIITSISINPINPNTTSNLGCYAKVLDSEQSTINVEYYWYKNNELYTSGTLNLNNDTVTLISTINYENTKKGETWNCTIRAFDGSLYSDYNSTTALIQNSPPNTPILISPTNNNLTVHDRRPLFLFNSTDVDGDDINYTINISFSSTFECGPNINENTSNASYKPNYDFCLDKLINWTVIAFDGLNYSSWSETWNFTIESYLSINLTTNSIDFGVLNVLESKDTENGYNPLIVENDGNVLVNLSIGANQSLFETEPLNTIYFRYKADNTTEMPSFDYLNSQTTWANITEVSIFNSSLLGKLNYSDEHDTAQIDINVTVPMYEPGGQRSVTLYIIGEMS